MRLCGHLFWPFIIYGRGRQWNVNLLQHFSASRAIAVFFFFFFILSFSRFSLCPRLQLCIGMRGGVLIWPGMDSAVVIVPMGITCLSCGQICIIRYLPLVIVTGEKCPSLLMRVHSEIKSLQPTIRNLSRLVRSQSIQIIIKVDGSNCCSGDAL